MAANAVRDAPAPTGKAAGPRGVSFRDEERQARPEKLEKQADVLEEALFNGGIERDSTDAEIARRRERWRHKAPTRDASAQEHQSAPPVQGARPRAAGAAGVLPSPVTSREEDDGEDDDEDDDEDEDEDDDDDGFDLFAENADEDDGAPSTSYSARAGGEQQPSASIRAAAAAEPEDEKHAAEVADDEEGYMTLRPGDTVGAPPRYVVRKVAGKGVFSSVVVCEDATGPTSASAPVDGSRLLASSSSGHIEAIPGSAGQVVAIKIVRANETMHKAAMKEAGTLASIAAADPHDTRRCVRLKGFFEWRGHVCLVFEALELNLREVIDRFGKQHGLSGVAVRTFGKQLLTALQLMERLRIVHADIKPQNILVDSALTSCKLCDFGSAFLEDSPDNVPTPLLVSRFYRAPEVILGLHHTPQLDLWSVGCVLFEMYTGRVLFSGRDNSDMLWQMMQLRGVVHNKLVKAHLRQVERFGMEAHFEESGEGGVLRFLKKVQDPVTGEELSEPVVVTRPSRDLGALLVPSTLHGAERRAASQLRDLLDRILTIDRTKRISVSDALEHPFFAPDQAVLVAEQAQPAAAQRQRREQSSAESSSSAASSSSASATAPAVSAAAAAATMRTKRGWTVPAAWKHK